MPIEGPRETQFQPFLTALARELKEQAIHFEGRLLSSIFFGGGTPSLLEPEELGAILGQVRGCWEWEEGCEVTVEVNPDTMTEDKAKGFLEVGVNRLSIGVQALDASSLGMLGRQHDAQRARECLETVRSAGFENVSLDFIFGRPGQTLESWGDELDEMLTWPVEHFSLYELILEPGTPMTRAVNRGELILPEEEARLGMYRLARERMESGGMGWYEVSNYCLPGRESRHNLDNWRGGEYLGVGPGAHSFGMLGEYGARRANPRNLPLYLSVPEAAPWNPRSFRDAIQEELLNGLRLREGIDTRGLFLRLPAQWKAHWEKKLTSLQEADYMTVDGFHWTLTPRGVELLDSILVFFDPDDLSA